MKYKLLLILATVIWGSSFVIVKDVTDVMSPEWLLALRFPTAAIILAIAFWKKRDLYLKKEYIGYGCLFGLALFSAYLTQTIGITDTTPGKNAFLTATYVVIVPFLAWFVQKVKPTVYNISAALLCIAGIGFVSLSSGFSIGFGDTLTLVGALFYAVHICLVARFSEGRDIFVLTMWQFAAAGVLALAMALLGGPMPEWGSISLEQYAGIGYLAVFCTCVALLFQNVGQAHVPASTAALLLSFEALFGVLFSVILGAETLSLRVVFGFALIFFAVVVSETQLEFLRKKKTAE